MFQFIHAADIHLDSPLRGLDRYEGAPIDQIRLATRRALENLVELALQRQVAFVLIAGDLFDGDWKDYNTGLYFARQMSRLRQEGIPVFIVKGNHDAANKITRSLKMPDNVHVFSDSKPETLRVERCNVAIHGQSFSASAVLKNLAEGYPKAESGCFNIGVLHTCATGREGHEPYAPCTMSDSVAKGYDYWALGHVHKREVLNTEPLIVFPGNLQGRHIRETGPKGCTIVTVDERHRPTEAFEELSVLRWEHCVIDARGTVSEDDVLKKVAKKLSDLLSANADMPMAVRIELVGACKTDSLLRSRTDHCINQIRAVATDCARDQIWVEKVKIHTSSDQALSGMGMLDGPIGELVQLIEELGRDDEQLSTLREELADLDKKLPVDVKESIGWSDGAFLKDVLHDVQDILLDRLAQKG